MNKKTGDLQTCAGSSTKIIEGFLDFDHLETNEHLYSPIQELQTSFIQENHLWEKKIATNVSGSSFDELKSVLQKHKLAESKNSLISEFVLEKQSPIVPIAEEKSSNRFGSFNSKESGQFISKQQKFLPKNDLPSLFVHDNYFKKHGMQTNEHVMKEESDVHKIEGSRSFQCIAAQSFSSTCITQSSNGNGNITESSFKNSHQSSVFSAFQKAAVPTVNQSFSESSLYANTSIESSNIVSGNNFEYLRHSNVYKFNSEVIAGVCHQGGGFDSMSESDDDEEEEESNHELSYVQHEPIEYFPITTSKNDSNGSLLMIEYDMKKDKLQQVLHKIALELLTTERTYVGILHLLDQVFAFRVDQENRAHSMFPQEVVSQMFTNLKSLYKLHHDFLLPQLEERMAHWEDKRRIGDIMKSFAPFLKMYTEYVKNYDNAVKLINVWSQKNQRFQQIMEELHALEECKQLTLPHHMLTPVQRVPRYQLLLKDYLKKLPEDSPDKCDTEKALELVSIAANHANDTMKKIDKFKKLLEIQDMIGGSVDLVSPSRELLREGKIIKISARSGDHQERYIFLFSDLLLLCSQRLLPNKVVSGPCFRVRARLDVNNLIVEEGDNLETANTFYIRTTGRVIELYTATWTEKMDWIEVLSKAVTILAEKKKSLKVGEYDSKLQDNIELGTRAPNFVKLESTSHCMSCDSIFSTFTFRRKHHCHACGIVACNKCLLHKIQLPYEGGKHCRVCKICYDVLVKDLHKQDVRDGCHKKAESPQRQRGILDVNPADPSVVSGYLQLKARSRFWVRRWFALHDDFVLYSFNSHVDEMALTSMPLPGYTIGIPDKSDIIDGRENVFKLFHKKKIYFFQAADQYELQRWVSALDKASRAETLS